MNQNGTDITSGQTVNNALTSTSTKTKALSSEEVIINVTPITSLVTKVLTESAGTIDAAALESSVTIIKNALNITEDDLEQDFIQENNANVTKIVTQLETTTKSLTAAIDDSNITEDKILDSIVNEIIETNNVVNFSNSTNITNIITQVEADNAITITDNIKLNTALLISQVNTKVQIIAEDINRSFEDIVTETTQLSVATNNTFNSNWRECDKLK